MNKVVFEKTYDGFESLYDIGRDIDEAFDERFNPVIKDIPGEFQGRMKVVITYEEDDE
jgi:hypothetical protein